MKRVKNLVIGSCCLVLALSGASLQLVADEQHQRQRIDRNEIRRDLEEMVDSMAAISERVLGRPYTPAQREELKREMMNKYYEFFSDKYMIIDSGDRDTEGMI